MTGIPAHDAGSPGGPGGMEPGLMPPARLAAVDAARVIADVLVPIIAQGVILRRRRVAMLAGALQVNHHAAELLRQLRERYNNRPLLLRLGTREVVIPLDPADAALVLAGTPEPYAAASREKRAALRHFSPQGVLVSTGSARTVRRRFNERVLQAGRPDHDFSARFTGVIAEELARFRNQPPDEPVRWDAFNTAWQRIVRRIVLGDAAAGDTTVTAMLTRLRAAANWAYLHPQRRLLREEFARRVRAYFERAEPGSLVGLAARTVVTPEIDPAGQVPHWMFAYDAAGITVWRTLAVAATHPDVAAGLVRPDSDRYAGACVHETLRLWPTTLAILRDLTRPLSLGGVELPAGTTIALISTWLHRDGRHLDAPHSYRPQRWESDGAGVGEGVVPFSGGPARCPGEDLVTRTAGAALAEMAATAWRLEPPTRLSAHRPLPYHLDHYRVALSHG